MTWGYIISARMSCDATMALNHIVVAMTCVMWREEHLWNASVPQEHFSGIVYLTSGALPRRHFPKMRASLGPGLLSFSFLQLCPQGFVSCAYSPGLKNSFTTFAHYYTQTENIKQLRVECSDCTCALY